MSDLHFLRPFWFLARMSSAFIITAGFRRGWLLGLLIMLLVSPPLQAFEWRDLWMRNDQQGAEKLSQGQAVLAAQLFTDPAWRGVALYQAGDYVGAAEAFAQSQDINAGYNRGNAFAKAGQLEQAALAYREVLRESPEHTDARTNLTLIEELLQQQLDQFNGNTQDDQQLQEPLQPDNDSSQLKQEDHEDAEDSAENSETNETQESTQNDHGDSSEPNQQDTGNNSNQMLSSDQIQQTNDMEAARLGVRDQEHQQNQPMENQMSAEQQVEEKDQTLPVENIDDEIELPSDQTQQTDDMEAAREDVKDQVQQQDQPMENQLSAEQQAEEKDQAQSDKDELETARQDAREERQQQDQHMENQMPIEQLSDKMNESLTINRAYDETELAPDQWLRLIPDDPSGLLRRKFMLEHLRRQQNTQGTTP